MNTIIFRSTAFVTLIAAVMAAGCASSPHVSPVASQPATRMTHDSVRSQSASVASSDDVIHTECAFAESMAKRDFAAFASFLDPDTVFFNGKGALFGKDAVVAEWKPYFEGPQAPFSWVPTQTMRNTKGFAYTTGPVFNAQGKCVARFNSIWKKNADGAWRIVFDKGDRNCDPSVIPGGEVTGAKALEAARELFTQTCYR
jgi:ketosteroid isomerase-like protein